MKKYTLEQIAEIVFWEALEDTECCGPTIYVDEVNERFGTNYSHEDLCDAICKADTEDYLLEIENYVDDDGEQIVDMAVSCLFGDPEQFGDTEWYDEIIEFQESGEMDRIIDAHLSKYRKEE